MHAVVPSADFVLMNTGGFRSTWFPGVLEYQHFFGMFPFNNTINSFDMTGEELIKTLRILQSGRRAFYATYGLSQEVTFAKNGTKQFIKAKLYNGSEIEPTKTYRGASVVFLTNGGDDFQQVLDSGYRVRNQKLEGDFQTQVKQKLKELKKIYANTLVNPDRPRLKITFID